MSSSSSSDSYSDIVYTKPKRGSKPKPIIDIQNNIKKKFENEPKIDDKKNSNRNSKTIRKTNSNTKKRKSKVEIVKKEVSDTSESDSEIKLSSRRYKDNSSDSSSDSDSDSDINDFILSSVRTERSGRGLQWDGSFLGKFPRNRKFGFLGDEITSKNNIKYYELNNIKKTHIICRYQRFTQPKQAAGEFEDIPLFSPIGCIVDELKPFFGLNKIGTHYLKLDKAVYYISKTNLPMDIGGIKEDCNLKEYVEKMVIKMIRNVDNLQGNDKKLIETYIETRSRLKDIKDSMELKDYLTKRNKLFTNLVNKFDTKMYDVINNDKDLITEIRKIFVFKYLFGTQNNDSKILIRKDEEELIAFSYFENAIDPFNSKRDISTKMTKRWFNNDIKMMYNIFKNYMMTEEQKKLSKEQYIELLETELESVFDRIDKKYKKYISGIIGNICDFIK